MHIKIENEGTPDTALYPQPPQDNDQIIKNTVAFAVVGEGMVGTPGQIGGNPVSQCGPSSPQRSTDHGKRALDKLPRPGQAEAEQCLALQRPIQKGVDIFRRMYAKNIFEGYRLRLNDFLRREDASASSRSGTRRYLSMG